jgi:hypothetical protein
MLLIFRCSKLLILDIFVECGNRLGVRMDTSTLSNLPYGFEVGFFFAL